MADHGFDDADTPRRLRRGPPPRLYVIARQSPIPWLRVRRLAEADRAALLAHIGRLMVPAGDREVPDAAGIAGLDLTRVVAHGAIAGNAVVAAAFAVPGPQGPEIVATEEPDYRGRGLGAMLASQVLGTGPGQTATAPSPGEAESALLQLLRSIGMKAGQEVVAELDLARSA
jgi:hypothetical protein